MIGHLSLRLAAISRQLHRLHRYLPDTQTASKILGAYASVSRVPSEDWNRQGPVSLLPPLLLVTNDVYNLST